ncbi:hypothetical protein OHU34_46165 (plasmid) [Streptomyces sp. NBC_00080]|uniref:hypothetical protein n=1 Tax=Streptomyces sp. NBC_00080 TaxID=2975645 RepID=UPI002F90B811
MGRVGGVAPSGRLGEAAIALSTVQYLVVPDWAADLDRYQALMEALLDASGPAAGLNAGSVNRPAGDVDTGA